MTKSRGDGGAGDPGRLGAPPPESVAGVLTRIRSARDVRPDGVVAFDADGTLWTGDVGIDLFSTVLRENALRPAALDALSAEAEAAGLVRVDDATQQAEVLYRAFLDGAYAEDRAYAMMAWAFAGFDEVELDGYVARVLADAGLAGRSIDEACAVIRACGLEGIDTYVVSASPRAAVRAGLSLLGIEVVGIAAMTPVVRDGVVQTSSIEPWPYAHGKTRALSLMTNQRAVLAAFGDSAFDVPMLRAAGIPVAVRPKPELCARRHEVDGLVLLSPR